MSSLTERRGAAIALPSTPSHADETAGSTLAAFRVVVGVIGAVSCARFLVHGWVDGFWITPRHHFHWPGLWWVRPAPPGWMHAIVAAVGVSFAIAAWRCVRGRSGRAWMAASAVGFGYLGAIDVAPYLNHYALLWLAAALSVVLPDGVRVPRWAAAAPRLLVGSVYAWAAVAKVDADWLSGRTVRPWLASHVDWPLVGGAFRDATVAQVLSVAGLLFDATVVPALLWRRSRGFAFAAAVCFHVVTAALFPIGVFPWLMTGLLCVFADADRFERTWARARRRGAGAIAHRALIGPRAVWFALGALAIVPVRGYLSDVGWSEQGGRFAWRVMAVDKVALAELHVVAEDGATFVVRPERDLSPLQVQQVGWQPDLLLQWAHLVAAEERARSGGPVSVYADVWISVAGRPPARFVDPTIDLAREHWTIGRPSWVLADQN